MAGAKKPKAKTLHFLPSPGWGPPIGNPFATGRLGFGGDFEEPDRARSRSDARNWFLAATRYVQPKVLEDLTGEPFDHYLGPPVELSAPMRGRLRPLTWNELRALGGRDHRVKVLAEDLQAWGRRWRLSATWCREAALRTLAAWSFRVEPDGSFDRSNLDWSYGADVSCDPPDQLCGPVTFAVDLAGWDPRVTSRSAAEWLILDQIAEQVQAYFDAGEERAREHGPVKAPTKREHDHFLWAARYQVCRWSFPKIGEIAEKDAGTVSWAVGEVLGLVGLPQRPPGKGGHPKKEAPGAPESPLPIPQT